MQYQLGNGVHRLTGLNSCQLRNEFIFLRYSKTSGTAAVTDVESTVQRYNLRSAVAWTWPYAGLSVALDIVA